MKVPSNKHPQPASVEPEQGLFMKKERKACGVVQAQERGHLLHGFLGKRLG
jgi:hypothetical protein